MRLQGKDVLKKISVCQGSGPGVEGARHKAIPKISFLLVAGLSFVMRGVQRDASFESCLLSICLKAHFSSAIWIFARQFNTNVPFL